jgi:hypothetical protein
MQRCAATEAASCVEQAHDIQVNPPIVCDVANDWVYERTQLPSAFLRAELRVGGQVCASAAWGGAIVHGPGEVHDYAYRGRPVGVGTRDRVLCGPVAFAQLASGGTPPCTREYRLEPARPECAKWAPLFDVKPVCTASTAGTCACR